MSNFQALGGKYTLKGEAVKLSHGIWIIFIKDCKRDIYFPLLLWWEKIYLKGKNPIKFEILIFLLRKQNVDMHFQH